MEQTFSTIVYIAAVLAAIYGIYQFIIRPFIWSKNKKQELECEYQKRTQAILQEGLLPIRTDLNELGTSIEDLKQINLNEIKQLEWMNRATLDLLRQEIMYLYNHHYEEKKLTVDENTQLHKLHDDYIAGGGNSFISDLVGIMSSWEIVPNNDTEHK